MISYLNLLPDIERITVILFILVIDLSFMPLVCNQLFGNFIACMFFQEDFPCGNLQGIEIYGRKRINYDENTSD